MPSQSTRIARVTLNTATFTEISALRECNVVRIANEDRSADITVRSDAADSSTAKRIPPGGYVEMGTPGGRTFQENDPVVWAIVSAGTGPAVVEFM